MLLLFQLEFRPSQMETASVLVGDIVVENMFLLICLDLLATFGIIFHSILLGGLKWLEIGVIIK